MSVGDRRLCGIVMGTYGWSKLMDALHREAGLDVWCERIEEAVFAHLSEAVNDAVAEWADDPSEWAVFLEDAGYKAKAPATLTSATGA